MSEPRPPDGEDHVPDHVLDELLEAFSDESAPQYDFDDPSIDRILGITDEHAEPEVDALDDETDDEDDLDDELAGELAAEDELAADDVPRAVVENDELAAGDVPQAVIENSDAPNRRTIVIADDDRPDTVYLDDGTERRDGNDDSGGRSTIVIADLDEHGVTEPPTATSRGATIDPRIRARRISVRRAEGRRRLIWVAIGGVVVVLAVAAIAVFASSIFDVRDVEVQGAVYTDQDVLQSVIDDLRGEPVLLVDTKAAEQRLEAVPWVESARVQTDFPHGVLIDIREREPVATFQGAGDGDYRVIDAQGRVLAVIVNQPADYLLITGSHPDTGRGQFAGAPYAGVAEMIISLPDEIRALTSSVGLDPVTGTITMVLAGDGVADGGDEGAEVRIGDADDLDDKLARLLRQVRSGLDGVCGLDVSTAVSGVVQC